MPLPSQNPAGEPHPDMPVWVARENDLAGQALLWLKNEYEPSDGESEDDEEAWLDDMPSDDEEWGSLVRKRRQQQEERAARAQWGPQLPATPQQLAAALAGAVARGGSPAGMYCGRRLHSVLATLLTDPALAHAACIEPQAVHCFALHCTALPVPNCAADAAIVEDNRMKLGLLVKLVCQMGDIGVGTRLLNAFQRKPLPLGCNVPKSKWF